MNTVDSKNSVSLRDCLLMASLSCAVLLYEIAVTRVLSVVLWYHFAFLVISLAMLGLGLPGVWFAVWPPTRKSLDRSLLVSGMALPLSCYAMLAGTQWFSNDNSNVAFVVFVIPCILIPMLSLGSGICILLLRSKEKCICRMYGSNLLGAMTGAMLILPLMFVVPAPLILAGIGLLPLTGLGLLLKRYQGVVVAMGLIIVAAMIWGKPFEVRRNKLYNEKEVSHIYEKWTPTARITILPYCPFKPNALASWGWGWGTKYTPRYREQWWIDQDGSAGTPIERANEAGLEDVDHIFFDVTSAGFLVRQPKRVCIIGAGGGRDIWAALASGAESVDAVELNGAIVSALSGPFSDFSGDVYHRPGVNAVVSEGRSFLTHSKNTYDLIQISLVDSWAATAAGAYALSENYLYTVEAFELYYRRLKANGLLSVSRYFAGRQQMEGTRLTKLALESLKSMGVYDAAQHIAVLQGGKVGTLLMSRMPWTDEDLSNLRQIAVQRGFTLLWPCADEESTNSTMVCSILGGTDLQHRSGSDMNPPTDDKPFFFQSFALWTGKSHDLDGAGFNEASVIILRTVIIVVCVISAVLYFLPFVFNQRLVRGRNFWSGSAFFAAIGFGFMLIEMPWIQRFILYLGHPSYAVTVVLSGLFLGSALGALMAGRLSSIRSVVMCILLIPVVIVVINSVLNLVFEHSIDWALGFRCLLGLVVLIPAGFVMGLAFPLGILHFGDLNKAWFLAMNGIMGVAGSVVSLGLAMTFGFSHVLLAGVLAYLIALLSILCTSRPWRGCRSGRNM